MRIQPKDLAALASTYQTILTEAHDETGSAIAAPETVKVLSDHDEDHIKQQIDHLITDLAEERDDYQSVEMDALEFIMAYAQERLQDLGHLR